MSSRKMAPVLFSLRNAAWDAPLAANHTTAVYLSELLERPN